MSSSSKNAMIAKQSLKVIEVPLNKFSEEVIPHHQQAFADYKTLIQELIAANNIDRLSKESRNKKRTIKQLQDLSFELDTLRAQVEDKDLDVFDSKTVSLRKLILGLINGYSDIEKSINQVLSAYQQHQIENAETLDPFAGAQQIQIQENIDDLKLKEHESRLKNVESIQQDIEGLNGLYSELHQLVGQQGEQINAVEDNVEVTNTNVNAGLKELVTAHKLKVIKYPLTGAVIGSAFGGPVGFFAGAKIGALAAVGFAFTGYIVGTVTKKFKKKNIDENVPKNTPDKKDI